MRRPAPPSRKAALLATLTPFAACTTAQLEEAARLVDESRRPAGAALTRQGRLGVEVFVIVEGTVEITRDGEVLATLGAGDVLGEIALLDGTPRSATATCRTATTFLVLDPRAFAALMRQAPVADHIRATAGERTGPSTRALAATA